MKNVQYRMQQTVFYCTRLNYILMARCSPVSSVTAQTSSSTHAALARMLSLCVLMAPAGRTCPGSDCSSVWPERYRPITKS